MGEEAAFLNAILAAPDDATARLVYADWLDDRGDPRADYLRLGALLAESPPGANRISVRDRMHESQLRLPSWWLAVVGFHATKQRPDLARIEEAARILKRPAQRAVNGYAVTIEVAAVSGLTGAVAFLESWSKWDAGFHDITYHFRLSGPAGHEASCEPYTYNPYFGCRPQFLEWYGDAALMIYREKHAVYACRLEFTGPPAHHKLADGWVIDGRELGFQPGREGDVQRLSLPDLTQLPPLTENEARERDLWPSDR